MVPRVRTDRGGGSHSRNPTPPICPSSSIVVEYTVYGWACCLLNPAAPCADSNTCLCLPDESNTQAAWVAAAISCAVSRSGPFVLLGAHARSGNGWVFGVAGCSGGACVCLPIEGRERERQVGLVLQSFFDDRIVLMWGVRGATVVIPARGVGVPRHRNRAA